MRVAAWDGWCGACAAERPLVLTRTGRRTVRSWWAGLGDDHLVLTLTCRLCGVGVDVPPHEEDDPEPAPVAEAFPGAPPVDAELRAARQAVADVVAALARRTAAAVPAPRAAADAVGASELELDLLAAGYARA